MFGPLSSRSAVAIAPSPPRAGRRRACRPGGPLSRPDASVLAEASAAAPAVPAAYARCHDDGLWQHARGGRRPDRRPGARQHALRPHGRAGAHRWRAPWAAGVSAPTASGHLARLAEARLVAVERQGRHRYHRLATPEVARAVEALMAVAAAGP